MRTRRTRPCPCPCPHPGPPLFLSFHPVLRPARLQVPVHCIGIQAYLWPNEVTFELMAYRLDMLGSLGLPLYITEFLLSSGWGPNAQGYTVPVNTMDQVGHGRVKLNSCRLLYVACNQVLSRASCSLQRLLLSPAVPSPRLPAPRWRPHTRKAHDVPETSTPKP